MDGKKVLRLTGMICTAVGFLAKLYCDFDDKVEEKKEKNKKIDELEKRVQELEKTEPETDE